MKIYQVLHEDQYMHLDCVYWTNDLEEAEKEANERTEMFGEDYWVEEGTHFIKHKCRGCNTPYADDRYDAHGIQTGVWCEKCYNSNKYPYRRDKYATIETHGYGERLNDDY